MGRTLEAMASEVVRAVLSAADPSRAVERAWPGEEIAGKAVRLLVVGKAAVPMARRGLELLGVGAEAWPLRAAASAPETGMAHGSSLAAALVATTPHEGAGALGVETLVADHPLATERNVRAAVRVEAFVGATRADEVLLVLLSGGGSALLTSPVEGLGLEDLRAVTDALLRAGTPIGELNSVRKHCERLKGGRMARLVGSGSDRPRVIVLVVSDVLGDRLDVISSGPLAADPTTYAEALRVIEDRGVAAAVPRVVEHLRRGVRGEIEETPKAGDAALAGVVTRVIAGNQSAVLAARDAVIGMGFGRVKVVLRVEGEASVVGAELVREAMAHHVEDGIGGERDSCVIYGGETTVTVGRAAGLGGRNQELALAAALEMGRSGLIAPVEPHSGRTGGTHGVEMRVLTLATDGVDGPTDAAGAMVSADTVGVAREHGVDLEGALVRHDSHAALGKLGCLVRTGATGTNVNDVAVAMVRAR